MTVSNKDFTIPQTTEVGNWAEAVEQENLSRIEGEDKVKTETAYTFENDVRYQVVTQFKVINKSVPKVVAERKKWVKFGNCAGEPPGPHVATTYVAEEVNIQFTRNKAGEQILDVQEEKQVAKTINRDHCRYCKGDHWSTKCPYKVIYVEEDNAEAEKEKNPVFEARGEGRHMEKRSDENTCRVTNLPQEIEEAELLDVFRTVGDVERVYIACDKITQMPKGFAFVTYYSRDNAARAIRELNNYKLNHMVLKVEWTRPSNH